jgi:hypothetical protein
MANFKHHKYFPKTKAVQQFRFPFVCFMCRKSFKYPVSLTTRNCPQCRGPMQMLSRKFAAPKSKDLAQWQKVKYLVECGFRFYPVYRSVEGGGQLAVRYPATLQEAAPFVQEFKAQAMRHAVQPFAPADGFAAR